MIFIGRAFCADNHSLDISPIVTGEITSTIIGNSIYDSLEAMNRYIENWNGENAYDWDTDTAFRAMFDGDLAAGNMDDLENFDTVKIKRRKKGDLVFRTMYSIDSSDKKDGVSFQIIDYTTAIGEYEYALSLELNGIEEFMTYKTVKCEFDGMFLAEPDRSYPMHLEASLEHNRVRGGALTSTLGSKYPYYISNGLANYVTGSASALFVQASLDKCGWDYDNGWSYRENVNEFLTDGRPKIIKADTGEIFLIVVQTDSISETGDYKFPVTSFNWHQCGDVEEFTDLYRCGFVNVYNEAILPVA